MPIASRKAVDPPAGRVLPRAAWIASLAVAAAAYLPLLTQYGDQLWSLSEYRLAPVILIVTVLSAYRRLAALEDIERGPALPAALMCALAAGVLGLAAMASAPELAAVSLLLLVLGLAVGWGGTAAVQALLGPGLLGCLLLRLPGDLDLLVFQSIARFDVTLAHRTLDAIGVLHDQDGLSIVLAGKTLWMGGASASVFSPWCGLALAMAVCVWQRRTWLGAILLCAAGCGWFVLVDVLRVVALVALSGVLEAAWAEQLAGGALDVAAAGLMLSLLISSNHVGRLFRTAFGWNRPQRKRNPKPAANPVVTPAPTVLVTGLTLDESGQLIKVSRIQKAAIREQQPTSAEETFAARPARQRLVPAWILLVALYGGLCLAEAAWLPSAGEARADRQVALASALHGEMPEQLKGWRLEPAASSDADDDASETGLNESPSARWRYRRGSLTFVLAARVRGAAWHDPVDGWLNRGWEVVPLRSASAPSNDDEPPVASREVILRKPYEPGYVSIWQSECYASGRSWSEPPTCGWQAGACAAAEQLGQFYRQAQSIGQSSGRKSETLDVEGVLFSYNPLGEQDLAAGRELYALLAERFQRNLSLSRGAPP